ncbi:HdeD family acid-resistance protein [Streptacidiphilus sp. EB129]|uniref:HdeD family acid-resistance protein n=1 Tax=Streptacidiphilus sp. EB129 TaxID=3156262 RepID=UPI003512304A
MTTTPTLSPDDPFDATLGRLARSAWQAVLVAGIAAVVVGILALVWPKATLSVVGVFFGIFLLISGVVQVVAAFGTHVSTPMRVLVFISGAICILLGLFCFRGTLESILLLALWIGIGWLFRGITQIVAAASDPGMPARGWQVFLGALHVAAGAVLITWPIKSVHVLTVVTGCWLLVVGVVEVVTALRIRSITRDANL